MIHLGELIPPPPAEVAEVDDTLTLLGRLRDAWLNEVCDSPATRAAYTRGYDEWVRWLAVEGVQPDGMLQVRRHQIAAYRRALEAKGWKPATVALKLAILSSYYQYCEQVELIVRNPVASAKRPKPSTDSTTGSLTADEARRLIQAADQFVADAKTARVRTAAARDAAIVVVMLCTGGRVREVTRARIEDLGYDRGHRVLWLTRKGDRRQSVALGAAAAIVDRHVATEARTEGLIFQTSNGRPVDRAHILRVLRKAATAAHIPSATKLTPHWLRHTFATLAFDGGADISTVQDAMGHADPRTTRRYDRARNRIDRSPVHAVARSLLGDG